MAVRALRNENPEHTLLQQCPKMHNARISTKNESEKKKITRNNNNAREMSLFSQIVPFHCGEWNKHFSLDVFLCVFFFFIYF